MKMSEIFLKAAEKIDAAPASGHFGMCKALYLACSGIRPTSYKNYLLFCECSSFLKMFAPRSGTIDNMWFSRMTQPGCYKVNDWNEAKQQRIDILLWCATIAESEGL